jgi:hypothetical protein
MPYYKFNKNDIFYNTVEAKPSVKFDINDSKVYLNNLNTQSGAFTDNITHVPNGYLNLYELNVDRPEGQLIYPFITKNGSYQTIAGVTGSDWTNDFQYGDTITGSYPLSASLSRERFVANHGTNNTTGSHILALNNTLDYYTTLSPHYAFSSSLGDKSSQELTLLYIPSIFYGSSIDKGSVDLKFFISGTLVARVQDINYNGELVQTDGTAYAQSQGSGDVAGVVLYDEGIVVLTGSWDLSTTPYALGSGSTENPTWITFGAGAHDTGDVTGTVTPSASFSVGFNGMQYVETITMFAHADKNKLNYSTNQTFVNYASASANLPITSSKVYIENNEVPLANTVSSSFYNYEERFKHQTFINKIGIYDEKKNLIAVANLATPIKKTAERDFTFKLKLDI